MTRSKIRIYRAYLEEEGLTDFDSFMDEDDDLDLFDDDDEYDDDEMDAYFNKDFRAGAEASRELDTLGMTARQVQSSLQDVKSLGFPRGFRSELTEFMGAASRLEDAVERFPDSRISWKTQDGYFGNRQNTNYRLVLDQLATRRAALSRSRSDTAARNKIDDAMSAMRRLQTAYREARDMYR